MGLRGVDKSLFSKIALRGEVLGKLQGPTVIDTDSSNTEGLVGIRIFLDDRDPYHFRLSEHCGIFTADMCAIHYACDLIGYPPMSTYIILTGMLEINRNIERMICCFKPEGL
jgi:hypothetical protein